ncbi:hypothetical protein BpHYR1_047079 [Brachionus plicatilis]|uniref:Uncharacterized protein n=1 Tax=Brachionus plicatilis TaxID=10195 RepID=A0A3M7QVR4_BRAPC|nr:hypothetical protein BpHYR1_047079 [Brachionus plicatilis]
MVTVGKTALNWLTTRIFPWPVDESKQSFNTSFSRYKNGKRQIEIQNYMNFNLNFDHLIMIMNFKLPLEKLKSSQRCKEYTKFLKNINYQKKFKAFIAFNNQY